MPLKSWYNEELRIWEFQTEGRVDLDLVMEELGGIYGQLDPKKPFLLLWQSGPGAEALGSHDLQRLMAFIKENRPEVDGKTAIVAEDDATYGMSRVAQIYGEAIVPHLWVFRDRGQAIAWLTEDL